MGLSLRIGSDRYRYSYVSLRDGMPQASSWDAVRSAVWWLTFLWPTIETVCPSVGNILATYLQQNAGDLGIAKTRGKVSRSF